MNADGPKQQQARKNSVKTQLERLENTYAMELFRDFAADNSPFSGVNSNQREPQLMVSNSVSKSICVIYTYVS